MKTFPRFHLGLVILILLIGCSTANPANDPTVIPSLLSPSILSTKTAQAFSTSALNKTPGLTPIVFDQAAYDATQSVVQTKVAHFPRICKEDYSRPNFSPNDLWMEELCYSESEHDLVMTLSNRETKVLWKLLYRDHIPHLEFADGGISVVQWSKDGKYAYFFSFLGGDGGECFYSGRDRGSGLFRLDLRSGQTSVILPPNNNFWWYSFSFSSTDRRLVYGPRARDLKIRDLFTGKIIDIISEENSYETGGYLWSSDGLQLVYSVLTYDEQGVRENYSVRLVDTRVGSEHILLESPEDCFAVRGWGENNTLTIERYDKNYDRTFIEYDLNSNRVINESTSTLSP